MIYSTLSMFSLRLHHCIKFCFLKTENNWKGLARMPPVSICEQFDIAFGKFLSIPVLNRLCTSILTSNATVLNVHRTEYKISQKLLDGEMFFYM